ncbi:MAG: DUF2167 domain-containing protein [Paracoccaceae bacterium]
MSSFFRPIRRAIVPAVLSLGVLIPASMAQTEPDAVVPMSFTGALGLARGSVEADGANSFYVSKEDACTIAKVDWGWASCEGMDALTFFLVPGAESILFEVPNSDGYVTMDDWQSADKDEAIRTIETELAAGLRAQGEQLGMSVAFKRWLVYPTLDTEKKVLYYATESTWDGEPNINIRASVFDRQGYVAFTIVTASNSPTEAEVRAMVDATIAHYDPVPGQDYASYVAGDAVAATGALGVLAALVGVKFGKAALGGVIAAALVFLKKGGIVLLLLPIGWVKNRFFGKARVISQAAGAAAEPLGDDNAPRS